MSMLPTFLLDFLFPRRCPVCDGIVLPKGRLVCPDCVKNLSFIKNPVCKKCGKEVLSADIEYCFDCTRHKRSFENGWALLSYDETARKSMAKIKYQNKREYLDFYGKALCARYGKLILRARPYALVPVPVHPSRKRERGFNQAEILAGKVGEELDIPVCPELLVRNKKTMPQKGLDPAGRLKNLQEAFYGEMLPEQIRRVVLVDDIYTTGSTVEACTRALKKAGAQAVYCLVICIGHGH